jgi:hypothetical protein
MGKDIEASLARMRESPRGVRFVDACKVATAYFGEPRQRGTSHRIWKMPWPGDPRVNLQRRADGNAKPYQVRQLLQAIEQLLAFRQTPSVSEVQVHEERKKGQRSTPAKRKN